MKIVSAAYLVISAVVIGALGYGYYHQCSVNARAAALIVRPGQEQSAAAPAQVQRSVQSQDGRASASVNIRVNTPEQSAQPPKTLEQILDAEQAVIDDYNRRNPGANARLQLRVSDGLEAYNRQFMKSASNSY